MNRSVRRARTRPALAAVLGAALAIAIAACLPGSIRPTPGPTPTPPPGPTTPPPPTPTPGPPTPTPGPTFKLYKVSRGDTLTRIARRFHTSTRSLSYWNREAYPSLDPESAHYRPDRLELGWTLRVLPGQGVRRATGRRRDRDPGHAHARRRGPRGLAEPFAPP